MATFLVVRLLSGLRRRRGNSTGTVCWGLGFPGQGSASGGAPGGLAQVPRSSSSPEASGMCTGLDWFKEVGDSCLGDRKGHGAEKVQCPSLAGEGEALGAEKGAQRGGGGHCHITWYAKYLIRSLLGPGCGGMPLPQDILQGPLGS